MRKYMNRRTFIKRTARAAAAAGLAGCGPLLQGCVTKKEFDLVITDALIYDGNGGRPFQGDIAIASDTIKSIGKVGYKRGRTVIEAKNLAVAPGFIDVHDHSDISLLVNPKAESVIHQGITTLVSGNCGSSPFPIAEAVFEEERENARNVYALDMNWKDMAGFFARVEEKGIALNYATLVGQGNIRGMIVGYNDRRPQAGELERMKGLVDEHIRGGAFGLSTGLEYTPGSFAQPEEIAELCRVVARLGAVYATHMRDEGDRLLESLEESIGAALSSGVKLQISHLKVAYPRNWPKLDAALARIEKAKNDGVDIFCDRYPYIAASTGLDFYFPAWARQGTRQDFLNRLKDPSLESKLRAHLAEQEQRLGSWDKVLISSVVTEKNRPLLGKNILEAARESRKEPYDFIRFLLIEEQGQVGEISFIMNEEELKRILAHPLVGVGCDGSAVAPYGVLSQDKPHPRNYGTFPRVLGKYVRDEKILPAEEMIKKITLIPAARFGFEKRGVLRPGNFADLVVFDPDQIEDTATWVEPHQYPVGIEYVIVNGQVAVEHNRHTGRLPGRILKKKLER
jgi:N-acyl-D-amino-acid deacylase